MAGAAQRGVGPMNRKQFERYYRRHYRISWWRQFRNGSRIVSYSIGPCPVCHGNDRVKELGEAPGFVKCHCERCDETYLG